MDEIDPSPVVLQKSGAPVQGSLFPTKSLDGTPTRAVVKPDPGAIVPVYYAIEPSLQGAPFYGAGELSRIFNIKRSRVSDALAYGYIPVHTSGDGEAVITLTVFRPLYDAMCEGHAWEHACHLAAVATRPTKVEPSVPAEALHAPDPATPDSLKAGEENHRAKLSPGDSLNDPNPDATEIFTIEEAANVLGMDKPDRLFATISDGGFPAVMAGGQWYILRSDLKRLKGNLSVGLSIEEALKRGGAPECVLSVPVETSWTVNLAPLTPVEADEVAHLTPVKPAAPATETVDPAVTPDQHRRFTLEGLKGGVFSIDEAVRLLGGASDPAKTAWAFGLLREGRITVEQTVKLLG